MPRQPGIPLPPIDPIAAEGRRLQLHRELGPVGALQTLLVDQIARAMTRLDRADVWELRVEPDDPAWTRYRSQAERTFQRSMAELRRSKREARLAVLGQKAEGDGASRRLNAGRAGRGVAAQGRPAVDRLDQFVGPQQPGEPPQGLGPGRGVVAVELSQSKGQDRPVLAPGEGVQSRRPSLAGRAAGQGAQAGGRPGVEGRRVGDGRQRDLPVGVVHQRDQRVGQRRLGFQPAGQLAHLGHAVEGPVDLDGFFGDGRGEASEPVGGRFAHGMIPALVSITRGHAGSEAKNCRP